MAPASLLLWSALVALVAWALSGNALRCFDGDEPTCDSPPSEPALEFYARAGAWACVLLLSALAIGVAWRRRRGRVSRAVAIGAVAAPLPAAFLVGRLADIPLPV